MKRDFNVIIERDSEGFYVASVPALRGCYTQARSQDDLMQRIREAIKLCLEVLESIYRELLLRYFILHYHAHLLLEKTPTSLHFT